MCVCVGGGGRVSRTVTRGVSVCVCVCVQRGSYSSRKFLMSSKKPERRIIDLAQSTYWRLLPLHGQQHLPVFYGKCRKEKRGRGYDSLVGQHWGGTKGMNGLHSEASRTLASAPA